jgi:hypothetical protein
MINSTSKIVYALSHPITGELRYIGKSERGMRRPKEHGQKYHNKRLAHTPLYRWIKKLREQGLDYVIEVIEEFSNRPALMEGEKFYISYFRSLGVNLLNICDGGEGFTGCHTSEAKAKIAEASRQRGHTAETKARLSVMKKDKPLSTEHRKALCVPKTGGSAKGSKKPEGFAENLSKKLKGHKHSPEHILNMSRGRGGKSFMDENGIIYQTQSEAASALGLDQGSVKSVLQGKSSHAKGHVFAYLDTLLPGQLPTKRPLKPRRGGRPRKN